MGQRRTIHPGDRFGRLTVVREMPRKPGEYVYRFECICDCGKTTFPQKQFLINGRSTSCGCYHHELQRQRQLKHGYFGTPEYTAFVNARNRCESQRDISYPNYGGRGIKFRFSSYPEFLQEVGQRPSPSHTLDRINNDGHYEPGNVQWATRSEQRKNQRPARRQRKVTAHAS